jgi:hypothetical protein
MHDEQMAIDCERNLLMLDGKLLISICKHLSQIQALASPPTDVGDDLVNCDHFSGNDSSIVVIVTPTWSFQKCRESY